MAATNSQTEQDQRGIGTSANGNDVESAILHVVHQRESCTLDVLLLTLTDFTSSQVLMSVDRLSREGKITLRRPKRFGYVLSTLMSEIHSEHRP